MNKGYCKLKVLEQLLVHECPLSTELIIEFAGKNGERLEELQNFIDTVERIDTPLTVQQLSELTGLSRREIKDIENEGITTLTRIYQ